MNQYNKDIGYYSENIACVYLASHNYKIICRNFRTKIGELDIICSYKDILVIIEVKGRYSYSYGMPLESVDRHKQHNIIKVSKIYISCNNLYNINTRFDVIEVFLDNNKNLYRLNHIEDAFRII